MKLKLKYNTGSVITNDSQNITNGQVIFDKLAYVDWRNVIVTVLTYCIIITFTQAVPSVLMKLPIPIPGAILGGMLYIGIIFSILLFLCSPVKSTIAMLVGMPFLLLALWELASITWSARPAETMRASMLAFFGLVGCASIVAQMEWKRFIYCLNMSLTSIILFSIVLALIAPSIGRMQEIYPGAWSGVFQEKQALGFIAAQQYITALTLAISYKEYRKWGFAALLAPIAILGTQSKTALVMLMFCTIVIFIAWLFRRGKGIAVSTLWLVVVGTVVVVILLKYFPDAVFALLNKKKDFTGRTIIWEGMQILIDQRPMTGWGYGSIWRGQHDMTSPYQWIEQHTDFAGYNGHSSHLDMILQVGKIGYALFLTALSTSVILALWSIRRGGVPMYFSIATLLSVINISFTESILVGPMEIPWFLVTFIGIKFCGRFLTKDDKDNNDIDDTLENNVPDGSYTYTYTFPHR